MTIETDYNSSWFLKTKREQNICYPRGSLKFIFVICNVGIVQR